MNIHELDKNKFYICEVKITKQVAIDELYAYLKSVENVFGNLTLCVRGT